MSDAGLSWFQVCWPRVVEPEARTDALVVLAAARVLPIVFEAVGSHGQIEHRLGLPARACENLVEQLRRAIPGLGLIALPERPEIKVSRACQVQVSTERRSLAVDAPESVARAVLTALASAHRGESIVLQWQLLRSLLPAPVGRQVDGSFTGNAMADVSHAVLHGRRELDEEQRSALRTKRSLPGFGLVSRVGVHSRGEKRERQLLAQVVSGLRTAEAPGAHIRLRATKPDRLVALPVPWRVPLKLNVAELAVVIGWPVGESESFPIQLQRSRVLPPSRAVPREGRVLGASSFPGRERPVAIPNESLNRGVHVLGLTGVGKSTLLVNSVAQSIAQGFSVVAVDPKGDLITDIMEVVGERVDDVVLIDPTDPEAVVGINPLRHGGRSPELVADRLTHIFEGAFASWGPRLNDILFNACATLARTPGMSLACLPPLLSNKAFRRQVVGCLDEPLVLEEFWAGFEGWSDGERNAAVAPALTRIRPLLARPDLRALLGQADGFELSRVMREPTILLVSLPKGTLGPEGSSLAGSIIISLLWQAALERTAVPAVERRPVHVVVDEFQDFVHGVTDFAEVLSQSRGLQVGWTLANQHLGQLKPELRSGLANARNKIVFQISPEDAKTISSADPLLASEDFRSLDAFQAYAQVVADDTAQPWLSLNTLPPPEPTSDPDLVRARSREAHGMARETIDQQLRLLQQRHAADGDDLKPKRRTARP